MQKFALGGFVVAALMSAPATAADLPTKRMVSKAPIVAPMFSWTGFYIGANVGGAWGEADNQLSIVNGPPGDQFFNPAATRDLDVARAGTGNARSSAFTGGFQAGYNLQMNRLVLGIEADFGAMGLKGQRSGTFPYSDDINHPFSISTSTKTNWLLTVRPRIGYAFDRSLVYATGGLAVASLSFDQAFVDLQCAPLPACSENISAKSTRVGYAVGGGLEYAFANQWTVKGEYLYVDFGSASFSGLLGVPTVGVGIATFNNSVRTDAHLLRFGINYLFGGARY
jgi:outer membrane immunogenic protein